MPKDLTMFKIKAGACNEELCIKVFQKIHDLYGDVKESEADEEA